MATSRLSLNLFVVPAALDVPDAVGILVMFKRHFLLRHYNIEADTWFLYFYHVLECVFAEINDSDAA